MSLKNHTIKSVLFICLLMIMFVSCRNEEGGGVKKNDTDTLELDQDTLQIDTDSETTFIYNPDLAMWIFDYDSVNIESIKKQKTIPEDSLNVTIITDLLNQTYPFVQVVYVKTIKDTVFIQIPDSKVLTQQMGTRGAYEYMVAATYSYTELKGIRCVSFEFEEGDHAVPGIYDRESWNVQVLK